jgi:hypothetical protein
MFVHGVILGDIYEALHTIKDSRRPKLCLVSVVDALHCQSLIRCLLMYFRTESTE